MSEQYIRQIVERTSGDIYLGVVGPVRSGKSTFIKKFVDVLVLPNITDEDLYKKVQDELPQSSDGRTIMTTEPKFVPNQIVNLKVDEMDVRVRLVDCVGYIIPNSKGYEDENGPRMVRTPWFDDSISFKEAAEIGTKKVITDHSTIGVVVTTDGSVSDFSREDYLDAEERTVSELKSLDKPFIVVLNSRHPQKKETKELRASLEEQYNVPVIALSVENMDSSDVNNVLREALYEFKIRELNINLPSWISVLNPDHQVRAAIDEVINNVSNDFKRIREVDNMVSVLREDDLIEDVSITAVDPSVGSADITIKCKEELYNEIIESIIGRKLEDRGDFIGMLQEFATAKQEYDIFNSAISSVKQVGYGIASPRVEDMILERPEVIRQGARYGVRLKAVAPSVHMVKVDVESVFEPIIGSEQQSKDLIDFIMRDYEDDPLSIWKTEIFGRTLEQVVNDGINAKLYIMPDQARQKFRETLEKVVNKGSGGLIAIIL